MFEHSVKVPRHFKIAANIFKKVSTEGGSIKTLLYDNKLKHFRTDVLFALITKSITHSADIDKMFEKCSLLQNEPRLDPWLAKVLVAELLYGKKALPSKSKPELTVLSYKDQFQQYLEEHSDNLKTEDVPRPRYVRINTNLLTTSDAIRAFQDEGYKFIRCTSGSFDDYLRQIRNLMEFDFTQDYHVKTMFVFAAGTKFHEHELYFENKIILQSKSTALAVHLLAPALGSVVLDMCAAPGMKATQASAYIRNQGKIYAVERNERRYQTLCEFVEKTSSKCVETLNRDVLDVKRGELDDVEYILLDPSCSASGMDNTIHNYMEPERLSRLTSLQEKFLKHAMNSFPRAKRIVYSTCSLFPEENEKVISNVVKNSRAKWRVQDVKDMLKGQWNNFGSAMYGSMGTRCLYARPDTDLTTGFFLAVLDRDQKAEKDQEETDVEREDNDSKETFEAAKNQDNKHTNCTDEISELNTGEFDARRTKTKKNKFKSIDERVAEELKNHEIETQTNDGSSEKKKGKKSHEIANDEENISDQSASKPKKKKKHNKLKSEEDCVGEPEVIHADNEENTNKKKKRKRDKSCNEIMDCEAIHELDVTTNKKKKKKKDSKLTLKDSGVKEVTYNLEEKNYEIIVEESNKKNSDKKKRKQCLEIVTCEEITKTTKEKKRNKDVCEYFVGDNVDSEVTGEPRKKKKTKKNDDFTAS